MKKLKFKDIFSAGAIYYNPVLIQCVALCSVIIATTTLLNAVITSIILILQLLVTCFLASAVMKRIPRYLRVAVYLIIGLAISCPALWLLEKSAYYEPESAIKILIPLIAVNSLTAVHCETFSVKNKVSAAIYDAFASGVGTAGVMLLAGAVREILGKGTIWGYELGMPAIFSGISMPFGCLIILGFLAAALKAVAGDKITEETKKPLPKENAKEASDGEEEAQNDVPDSEENGDIYFTKRPEANVPEQVTETPEEVDMDFHEHDEEYLELLSSVDELIEKFSEKNGGDDK